MASQTAKVEESDARLVSRMAAGDQGALSELYDRHRGLVFALTLRVLRDRAEAEAALTDVFLQAWRGAAGFDDVRGSVAAWLVMLARSRAIDRVRGRARREAAHAGLAAIAGEGGDSTVGSMSPSPASDPAAHMETQ